MSKEKVAICRCRFAGLESGKQLTSKIGRWTTDGHLGHMSEVIFFSANFYREKPICQMSSSGGE